MAYIILRWIYTIENIPRLTSDEQVFYEHRGDSKY